MHRNHEREIGRRKGAKEIREFKEFNRMQERKIICPITQPRRGCMIVAHGFSHGLERYPSACGAW